MQHSFWSAPRIRNYRKVKISEHAQRIHFVFSGNQVVRLDPEQSDGKSMNQGPPPLDNSWCRPKVVQPLGMRMPVMDYCSTNPEGVEISRNTLSTSKTGIQAVFYLPNYKPMESLFSSNFIPNTGPVEKTLFCTLYHCVIYICSFFFLLIQDALPKPTQ